LKAVPAGTTRTDVSGAASVWQQIGAQARAELTMTLRRGESVLVTIIMPVVFLIFFAQVMGSKPPAPFHSSIDFLLPGLLAVAIMSTGMVSLGIATAYERYYGVLKRLGSSPLPRWGLLAAKVLAVLAVEVAQAALLCALAALLYGWRPSGAALLAIPLGIVGTATFAGIGLLMAGALRAEATLAGANGLYVVFLAIGGVFLPLSSFPAPLAGFFGILPPGALSNVLRGALTSHGIPGGSVLALCLWAVVIIAVAARTFRWE
jgi:ABC-2 type transport system permease protein